MAKKRKKTSFWTIALTAVVTAGAALGAIKLFGVPSELRPEGEVHLKVINKVTFDDLINDSVFYKMSRKMDRYYLSECYDYSFDDYSQLKINNIIVYSEEPEGLPDSSFAKSKRLNYESGAQVSRFYYIGNFVSSIRINYLDVDKKESSKYAVISDYKLLNPGDSLDNLYFLMDYINLTDNKQYAISYTNFALEEGEKLISFEVLADLENEENKSLSEVDQEVKSFAKVSFRNDKESSECTIDNLVEIVNKNKKLLKEIDESYGSITNGKFAQGGLMFESLGLNFDSNYFDFIKLTIKGTETKAEKGYEVSEGYFSGGNTLYCASNILDTSKAPKETIVFYDNNGFSLSNSKSDAVLLEMEFFTIEEVK